MRATMRNTQPKMAAMSSKTYGDPDMVLMGELLEDISRHPSALGARKLLVEHYMSIGWLDAALENATALKRLSPTDQDVTKFLQVLEKKPEPPVPEKRNLVPQPAKAITEVREWDPQAGRYKKKKVQSSSSSKTPSSPVDLSGGIDAAQKDLTEGYLALRNKARFVLGDLLRLQTLQKKANLPLSKGTAKIEILVEGRKGLSGSGLKICSPENVQTVARKIRDHPKDVVNLIITDFETVLSWTQNSHGNPSEVCSETIRTALIRRRTALEAALPKEVHIQLEIALMHVEHENTCLDRNYANTETMLMEEISDIPRSHFFVTEDNYAWDMGELAQAITSNGGVFRNPLSRDMFTPKDVKGILMHPLGKSLSALAVEQHEMSKGVRPATIEQMEKLSHILLEDQSTDTIPSRKAVDEFLAYVATLPELEQKAIDSLKCPAIDSHTGQAYDFSIGESVRDAKGNRVCFHKTGDFIQQAAAHLRQNQGAAPDSDKCRLM